MPKDFTTQAVNLLTLQFLDWIGDEPKLYADVMDGWRSSCPRFSVWEDCVLAGLVQYNGGAGAAKTVSLTALGQAARRRRSCLGVPIPRA
jgi:hypothetical protein